MSGIKLEGFQGLAPRFSKRLLPPMSAQVASNTKLLAGEIRGFRALREEADLTGTASVVRRTIRIPGSPDTYKSFDSRDVDILRSPLVNDSFDRYYWAGDGAPKYNTEADIVAAATELLLGVPTPTVAPVVSPATPGDDETRAYVYTFVSAYGEEGPPSPPTVAVGNAGQWDISGMQTVVPDAAERNILTKKIYRTVAGNATTSFFFVDEVPLAQATYADNVTSETAAAANLLESTSYIEPPSSMEGFVVMPNGYLVGWAGKRLLFSEPYRPHAWPAEYELSTEFDIVGLAVFGSTLVIATESQPYFGQGVTPASFTTTKLDAVEPCLSRRGMVSTMFGVYYPSINGLVLASGSGVSVITKDILTKEEWANFFPAEIYAAQEGIQYIAFTASNRGFLYDPQEGANKLVTLDGFTNVEGIETDDYTGNVYLLANDRYEEFDPNDDGSNRLNWRWYSKTYQFPKPVNFGAARINAEFGDVNVVPDLTPQRDYNTAFFAAAPSLNALGDSILGGNPAPNSGTFATADPENRAPLGGSLLYDINYLSLQTQGVRLIVHIRDKVVFDSVVVDESICRLPTGFKSDIWEFEMVGNTDVFSLHVAETPKGLVAI